MIGRVLSNRYELLERVGDGGMAFVYRARDSRLNRIVAVKILSPHYTSDEDFVRKFRREAQAAASLSSTSIVGIYDVGQDGDIHYIVMEFLHGKTLKQVVNEHGPLSVMEVLQVGRRIAEALQVAHKHGIIHRDIKPHNIMLTRDGHVKVTDFGIARAATTSTLTETGAMVGSVHYIAPEQARGGIVGEISDIYSLGVVLYELLAGEVPFAGESMYSIALKHLQEEPRPLQEINPRIPTAVAQIVHKAMNKEQAGRYQTAAEMARAINRLLQAEDEPVSLQGLVGDLAEPAALNPIDLDIEKTRVARPSAAAQAAAQAEAEAEQRQVSAKNKRRRWYYIGAGGVALLLAAFLFLFLMYRPGAIVEVPDLIDLTVSEAQRTLGEYNLGFSVGLELFSEAEPNVVVDQDILAGSKVRSGRMVTVTISKGPEYADVPDVTGKQLRVALIELQNADFVVAETINRVHSTQPVDEVIEQNPTGNTRLKRSTPIALTVSLGPAPQPFILDDLVGLSATTARQRLSELNLLVGKMEGPLDGVVVQQTPAANTQVLPQQTIDLLFGPKTINALVSYTVPEDSENNNNQIEILREDVNGLVLEFALNLKRGETVQRNVSGVGFLRITIKNGGQIVQEEVYP